MPPLANVWDEFLHSVLPAALVAVALMVPGALLAKRWPASAYLGSALAVAAGLAVGSWLRDQALPLTRLPGPAAWEWLALVTLAALAAGVIGRLLPGSGSAGWGLRGMVAAHAGWLLAPAELRGEHVWVPLVLGAVVLAEWAILEALDWGGLVALAAAAAALTASVVLIHAGSLRFSEIAMILGGALAGAGLTALVLRASAGGVSGAVAVMVPALLLSGWYETYSEVPRSSFALAALALLALAPSLVPAWRRNQRRGLWALQLVLLLVPLAGAIALAAQAESLDYE